MLAKGDNMYDQVTLGLNVDPFILSALKEDITSEDVSTNSVMPHPQQGEVDLICKEDGIICGLQVFERTFTLLDSNTTVEFSYKRCICLSHFDSFFYTTCSSDMVILEKNTIRKVVSLVISATDSHGIFFKNTVVRCSLSCV